MSNEVLKAQSEGKVLEPGLDADLEIEIHQTKTRSLAIFVIPPFPARTYPGRTMGPVYIGSHLKNTAGKGMHTVTRWVDLDLDVIAPEDRETILRETIRGVRNEIALLNISYLSFQADEAMNIAEIADDELRNNNCRNATQANDYVPIVCGGSGVTDADSIAPLYPQVDFFVDGRQFHEPLDTAVAIAKVVSESRILDTNSRKIPGTVTIDSRSQKVVQTPPTSMAESNVDTYFHDLNRQRHNPAYNFDIFTDEVGIKLKTAQLYTRTGCASSCVYCFESLRKPGKERSMESIRQELQQLLSQGFKGLYFDDSTFTENRSRALELIQLLDEFHRDHGMVWGFNTRIDCLDEAIIHQAKESGCVYMFAGVESLVPEVIEGIGKLSGMQQHFKDYPPAITTGAEYVERTKKVYHLMKELRLTSSVFLIMGAPKREGKSVTAATLEDDQRSVHDAIWDLEPSYLSMNIMRFIPNAAFSRMPLYEQYRGGQIVSGAYYYKKWRDAHVHRTVPPHPIYSAFESAGDRYPLPPHMTPEVCYVLFQYAVNEVNAYQQQQGRKIEIITDHQFKNEHLRTNDQGMYTLTPFDLMGKLRDKT